MGGVAVAADAMTLQLPPGRGIHGIAQLLGAHRGGRDLKVMRNPPPGDHILQNVLPHGTAADVAVADEQNFDHPSGSFLFGLIPDMYGFRPLLFFLANPFGRKDRTDMIIAYRPGFRHRLIKKCWKSPA